MTACCSHSSGWYRDKDRAIVAGVCAGIARHLDFNLTAVRIVTVILALCGTVFTLLVYAILALTMKPGPSYAEPPPPPGATPPAGSDRTHRRYNDLEKRLRDLERAITDRERDLKRQIDAL